MRNQLEVLSVPIDVVTMDEAVERVQMLLTMPGLHMVTTANAEMVMMAQQHTQLYKVLVDSELVVPDGAGVLWAAEQKGERFPERVAGCDLMGRLLALSAQKGLRVYLLGASPGTAERAAQEAKKRFGEIPIVGIHDGYFNAQEEEHIIKEITEKEAQLIFVALGVPKQELWIKEKLSHLSHVVAMGVGGSFDVLAGNIQRAPEWMQRNRIEWLYRLLKQPQRFMRMLALPKFMLAVWRHKG